MKSDGTETTKKAAWEQLGTVVESGPESISLTALPPGVALLNGTEPAAIADPALRQLAQKAAVLHRQEVDRWNAKQRALGHLRRIAAIVEHGGVTFGVTFNDDGKLANELAAAMSLAPGLPPELRNSLKVSARSPC